jgi:hypothetical protein
MHWPEKGRRRDQIPEVIVEEVAQAAGRLQLGHVRMQIQAVDTPNLKGDVVADNVGDVGHHTDLLGGRSPMRVLSLEHTDHLIGPNIISNKHHSYSSV